jgi:two-component system sensor histidine kinase PilS (NtrC family)
VELSRKLVADATLKIMSVQPEKAAPSEPAHTDLAWRIVGLTNFYRLLAVLVLLAVHLLTQPAPAFGAYAPQLFLLTLVSYFLLAVLLALAGRRYWPGRRTLVLTHALVDAGAVALLMYASGGISSNLGILMVIPVGSMALLAVGREALVIAAIAALAILAQQIASQLTGFASVTDYPLAGLMGVIVFLVAASAWPVANRLRETEAQVRRQEVDLANLAQLSQHIVQRLRESILVVDPSDRIRLINESAAEMLGDAAAVPGALLGEVSPRLLYLLTTWRSSTEPHPSETPLGTFATADGARIVEAHFAALGASEPAPVLIFLEDTSTLATRVQQSKLAALGRLTASIAHEIRNPVGAMSHAAQLLEETSGLGSAEHRLTEIMRSNAQRVSAIIDNVLRLSRREAPRPERIVLGAWLERFRQEFCATTQCDPTRFRLQGAASELEAVIDPSQLHQILWNLCENALRHGGAERSVFDIELQLLRVARYGRVCLEVADRGSGVAEPDVERIFEPFYTRGAQGTGLGLFLARELAEINRATLLYEPRKGGGSVFRLVFADLSRWASVMLPGAPVL